MLHTPGCMKKTLLALSLSGLAILPAGAIAATPLTLAPVGPDNSSAPVRSATGGLRVFSGFDPNTASVDDTKPFQNAAYEVRTTDGVLVQTVPNVYGLRAGDQPPTIELAAGSYRVTAWSAKHGLVTVPVTIMGGRLTAVHLEAGKS